ncbi:MAG: 50S ribosomal protein L21 [Candidatus Omnitrophica bacterium]|nr:50S ribosomal protein L21 [Candidatus Omnitrophota bacterium]MDD5671392.1 50S ribosomal protein L21 [Candidatus Omnitrophota bacterium]
MANYAIIETGGKQYRVEPAAELEVELLPLEENQKEVVLDQVLLVRDGDKVQIGTPCVKDAKVICESLGTLRGPKTFSFKFRRREKYRKKHGHRQNYLRLKVKEIIAGS